MFVPQAFIFFTSSSRAVWLSLHNSQAAGWTIMAPLNRLSSVNCPFSAAPRQISPCPCQEMGRSCVGGSQCITSELTCLRLPWLLHSYR